MANYRHTLLTRLPLLCLLLGLAACGGLGQFTGVDNAPAAATESPVATAAEEGLMSAADNPYLKARSSVSGTARRRFESAIAAQSMGDLDLAETDLQWLIENYPKFSGPYLNLALLYQQQGELTDAEHYFQAALEVNALNLTAYNQYAVFLREQGRFEEAEEAYLAALVVWDQHADTHRNLGVLYDLYRGDQRRALQHFIRYQELTGNQDRTVAGWIIDLERQSMALVREG